MRALTAGLGDPEAVAAGESVVEEDIRIWSIERAIGAAGRGKSTPCKVHGCVHGVERDGGPISGFDAHRLRNRLHTVGVQDAIVREPRDRSRIRLAGDDGGEQPGPRLFNEGERLCRIAPCRTLRWAGHNAHMFQHGGNRREVDIHDAVCAAGRKCQRARTEPDAQYLQALGLLAERNTVASVAIRDVPANRTARRIENHDNRSRNRSCTRAIAHNATELLCVNRLARRYHQDHQGESSCPQCRLQGNASQPHDA